MEITQEKLENVIKHSREVLNLTKFPQSIPTFPNPLALSKWYKNELSFVNAEIDKIESDCEIQCTCQKGCAHCCDQLIAITSCDLLAMKPIVSNFSNSLLASIKMNVDSMCSYLTGYGISINSPMLTRSLESQKILQDKYFQMHLKCPLLNENNGCMIYDVRPSLCWSYRCYEDPSACKSSYDVPLSIKYDDWESVAIQRLFAAKKPSAAGMMVLPFALQQLLKEIM